MRFFISNVVWAVCYISEWVIFRVLNSAISKNRSKYSPLGPPELLQFVLCSNHSVRPPPVSYSNHHLWTKFLIYPFLSHHFRIFILDDSLHKIPPDLLNVLHSCIFMVEKGSSKWKWTVLCANGWILNETPSPPVIIKNESRRRQRWKLEIFGPSATSLGPPTCGQN